MRGSKKSVQGEAWAAQVGAAEEPEAEQEEAEVDSEVVEGREIMGIWRCSNLYSLEIMHRIIDIRIEIVKIEEQQ